MPTKAMISLNELSHRLVRYDDLRPCTSAFIDARTPGSDRKENFTIIGPGVAENPDQYVHINIPHGFNIGAARQPPRCINSQHSHQTAEVFIVHSGSWRFNTGEHGTDGYVDLQAGDVISIPTNVFRGFENIGDAIGFLFAVLGGDNPGRVTWAPYVLEQAAKHSLVLLENGRLIDTTLEPVPAGAIPMPATTAADVARLRRYNSDEIASCVVRQTELVANGGLSVCSGFEECPIIGSANAPEQISGGKLSWLHGFQLRALRVAPHASCPAHSRDEAEVLLMQSGELTIEWQSESLTLRSGDVLTVPAGLARRYRNNGATPATVYVVRGGDHPAAARWVSTSG